MIITSTIDGGHKFKMEDCSSRIEDPIYPCNQDDKPYAFFGVFFCLESEEQSC
jgi:hypothetical protein